MPVGVPEPEVTLTTAVSVTGWRPNGLVLDTESETVVAPSATTWVTAVEVLDVKLVSPE